MPKAPETSPTHAAASRLAATLVVAAMLVAALSMWTAVPLTWIYIGSRLSKTQFPSGGPYMIVLVGIVVSILLIAWLIGRLNGLYVRITGTDTVDPMRASWLRSMRDTPSARRITVVEAVLVGSVLLAAVALGAWFLLLAGSPLPRS
ncbi:MAG: hypothetical protein U0R52_02110 [Solirubrobacterales bacterium]